MYFPFSDSIDYWSRCKHCLFYRFLACTLYDKGTSLRFWFVKISMISSCPDSSVRRASAIYNLETSLRIKRVREILNAKANSGNIKSCSNLQWQYAKYHTVWGDLTNTDTLTSVILETYDYQ